MKKVENSFGFDLESYLGKLIEAKIEEALSRCNHHSDWHISDLMPVSKAAPLLGYSSVRPIYQDIEDGLLRVGHEVQDRRRPGSTSSRYFVDIPAAKKRLAMLPEERSQ